VLLSRRRSSPSFLPFLLSKIFLIAFPPYQGSTPLDRDRDSSFILLSLRDLPSSFPFLHIIDMAGYLPIEEMFFLLSCFSFVKVCSSGPWLCGGFFFFPRVEPMRTTEPSSNSDGFAGGGCVFLRRRGAVASGEMPSSRTLFQKVKSFFPRYAPVSPKERSFLPFARDVPEPPRCLSRAPCSLDSHRLRYRVHPSFWRPPKMAPDLL